MRAAGAERAGEAHAGTSESLYFAAAVVSGFPTAQGSPAAMWVEQCLDLVHERFSAERQPHLVALCVFLAAVAARGPEAAAAARTWLPQPSVPSPSDRAPVLDAAQRAARRGALERVMTRIAQHARPLDPDTVDFSDVLSLRTLPLRTRLAFAVRFLADEAVCGAPAGEAASLTPSPRAHARLLPAARLHRVCRADLRPGGEAGGCAADRPFRPRL